MNSSQLDYIKNVLGVRYLMRPAHLCYKVYGSLNNEYGLLFDGNYSAPVQRLIGRMMVALGVSSYSCVRVFDFNHDEIQNLISKSGFKKIVFLGSNWQDFVQKKWNAQVPFHHVMEQEGIRFLITYSLSEFLGDSTQVGKRKLEVFPLLKSL